MFLSFLLQTFSWDPWLCLGENVECRYSSECHCSYYGLIFVTWKYNAMNKSWLLPQNWLRPAMFLSLPLCKTYSNGGMIKWFVEQVINHIWAIRFNVKQAKQKPLKVCITWKVVRFLEFISFQVKKNNMLQVILFTILFFVYLVVHSFFCLF